MSVFEHHLKSYYLHRHTYHSGPVTAWRELGPSVKPGDVVFLMGTLGVESDEDALR